MASDAKSENKYAKLFAVGSTYAAYRPTYPAELYDIIDAYAKAARRHDGPTLCVDVGCGTGQATLVLAKFYSKAIGVEGSQSQISAAAPADNIEYKFGTAEALPIEDSSADLVTVAQALHWFDLEKFWAEVRRVLRPGGTLAIWSYGLAHLDNKEADELFLNYHTKVMGPYWDNRRQMVDNNYQDVQLPFANTKRLKVDMGSDITLKHFSLYLQTQSCLKTFKETHPDKPDPSVDLTNKILAAYGGSALEDVPVKLTFDLTLLLGTRE